MLDVTAELPMLALIFTKKLRPMIIGSTSGWFIFEGIIARPRATSSRTNSAVISAAPGTYRSHTECKRDLLLNDAEFLLERANTFAVHDQNCGGFPCYREGIASDQLLSAIKEKTLRGTKLTTAQLIPDIEKYCESDSCQKSPFDDFDLQILKQVIAAVS